MNPQFVPIVSHRAVASMQPGGGRCGASAAVGGSVGVWSNGGRRAPARSRSSSWRRRSARTPGAARATARASRHARRSSGGGWPAFIVALTFIGLITMIVGEVATLLGCVLGIPSAVTGITFGAFKLRVAGSS